jgi:glycine cleavage system aminomethyltransferase T
MSLANEVHAVRNSAGLCAGDRIVCARVGGPDAQAALERVSPRELFVRPGQMLHTLLLDEAARPLADVLVCCDEEDYLVVAEGLAGPALAGYLREHAADLDVEVTDLSGSHAFLCLNGPYAWEVLAELTAPDVIGLPYLGFFHEGRFTCFRGSRAGEYGYDLMIERGRLPELRAAIENAGKRFDLALISPAALALCGLENWIFDVWSEAREGLTPIELQLQWRVSYGRTFPGSQALAARRRAALRRAVLVTAEGPIEADAAVELDGETVGTLLRAGPSHTRGDWLGIALLERGLAHAGLDGFRCPTAGGAVALRTLSAPAINNRSLFVDPQRHSYLTREQDSFPPLVTALRELRRLRPGAG